jgi:hypothetical protein
MDHTLTNRIYSCQVPSPCIRVTFIKGSGVFFGGPNARARPHLRTFDRRLELTD